ncbi:MAG TPA: FAD-binding protein, partial [Modicisalibacter sp.]|nr:FAD-binding protein [Modicisalibacter sp.]
MEHEQDKHSAHAERGQGATRDNGEALCERVRQADADKSPLKIVGGDTKSFYGRRVEGEALSLAEHRGITHYDPVELVISVRAGTPLTELEAALDAEG